MRGQRLGQLHAALHPPGDVVDQSLKAGVGRFGGDRVQRLGQRQAGVHHDGQLVGEIHQVLAAYAPPAGQRAQVVFALRAQFDDGLAVAAQHPRRVVHCGGIHHAGQRNAGLVSNLIAECRHIPILVSRVGGASTRPKWP